MTTAADWYRTAAEFRQLCGDANSQARDESSQEFASDMMRKANEHGLNTYLTDKQLKWLAKLADHEYPRRISRAT